MGEARRAPNVYSIAAHRGFADALVAGLAPRYADPSVGLARLTLLLPSSRARRTVTEAFVRYTGETGVAGMLLPRMVVVGDVDLDEAVGTLLDPLGGSDIPPAIDPTHRWLAVAGLIGEELGEDAPSGAPLLRLAAEFTATMDRLLVEGVGPEELIGEPVLTILGELAEHWHASLRLFARVQKRWLDELAKRGALDAAARRNRLFEHAAQRWREIPPGTPVVAAGITSAAPSLARLLRVVSELPEGAVILPDLDLAMDEEVWDELGCAGCSPGPGEAVFARGDALSHPQYHLKLLLNRMGVSRSEVRPWHRRGMTAAEPERSHAIGSVFLPPEASRTWVDLSPDKRRLRGVRVMETAHPEEEAQAIALLVREALETPEKRVAVVTPDRGLARRVVDHLARWNVEVDDSAGRPLSQTAAGRVLLLLAQIMGEQAAPVPLMALLAHPLVDGGMERGVWLGHARRIERGLRGPRSEPGLLPIQRLVERLSESDPRVSQMWQVADAALAPLLALGGASSVALADQIDLLAQAGEALCGEKLWAQPDGRALASFVENIRNNARETGFCLAPRDLAAVLSERMAAVAVRPPYGSHARVQVLGLLESRMSRADLMICAGLNEGTWPVRGGADALLAPQVLRVLGVPGADFRVGLSAHDLASALGAPEVVLSRARRDESGPAIPSRFLLRVLALLFDQRSEHDLMSQHREDRAVELARALTWAAPTEKYPRPMMKPSAEQRRVGISATALDRLRGDPYQFYAQAILQLRELDGLDADPSAAWQGSVAHEILERWHEACRGGRPVPIVQIMETVLDEEAVHPLMRGLWVPRLERALQWIAESVEGTADREVAGVEIEGTMEFDGVVISGRVDRMDRLPGGELAVVDYKTGKPPSGKQVSEGFALQLGLLGLIAEAGGFPDISGQATAFEYWSFGKSKDAANPYEFGYVDTPLKVGRKISGIPPQDFLPATRDYLRQAIATWITGDEPFTARLNPDLPNYGTYDQLMRLDEWLPRMDEQDELSA